MKPSLFCSEVLTLRREEKRRNREWQQPLQGRRLL